MLNTSKLRETPAKEAFWEKIHHHHLSSGTRRGCKNLVIRQGHNFRTTELLMMTKKLKKSRISSRSGVPLRPHVVSSGGHSRVLFFLDTGPWTLVMHNHFRRCRTIETAEQAINGFSARVCAVCAHRKPWGEECVNQTKPASAFSQMAEYD